ncbi:MAG: cupin domain-containing protein [Candidatus Eremiobacteraeota bacterium]|nr:cupin domain-containing protein [Candidatus Eremiobacteraeota bacterium]MBV9646444.1 cupin domain-containing protein [Candidatus Eremiobacteraeota bacterium]
MQEIINGFAMWSAWQPDRNMFFNSYFVPTDDGNLLIDPLPLDEADAAEIDRRGGVAWIVVTNRDHERATLDAVRRFNAKVASGGDSGDLHVGVDRVLVAGDVIGDGDVLTFDGLKTPGEIALFFEDRNRTAVVGDALWGAPAGSLRIMPKVADAATAALSLRKLLGPRPEHLLVGDGASVLGNAFEVLTACLDARDDAHVNVINIDELVFEKGDRRGADPPGYQSEFAEIGQLLGATKLGYQAARLPPGEAFCPTHWHTAEEELFIVWEGAATLRTPRGETMLRRGDIIAFPTNERGAHKVTNHTGSPCTIIMIANENPADACIYTDSGKVGVPGVGRVRTTPKLEYYEGET